MSSNNEKKDTTPTASELITAWHNSGHKVPFKTWIKEYKATMDAFKNRSSNASKLALEWHLSGQDVSFKTWMEQRQRQDEERSKIHRPANRPTTATMSRQ